MKEGIRRSLEDLVRGFRLGERRRRKAPRTRAATADAIALRTRHARV